MDLELKLVVSTASLEQKADCHPGSGISAHSLPSSLTVLTLHNLLQLPTLSTVIYWKGFDFSLNPKFVCLQELLLH